MCEPLSPPKTGHDWFRDVVDLIGCREVARIWGKSEAHVYRYCRDPNAKLRGIQNDACPNPVLKLQLVLREVNIANPQMAQFLADSLISIIQSEIPTKQIIPDKATLAEELLDTYPALVEFHQAIQAGEHPGRTGEYAIKAKREIDEDQIKYLESLGEIRPQARNVRAA